MKTLATITVAATLFLMGNLQITAQNRNTSSIKGSGNIITKTVETSPYNVINVVGSMEVYLEKGTEGNIQVTADDNVQDHILVASDGTTLTISLKNNTSLYNVKKIKLNVPFEDLSEVTLRGSGKIEGTDVIKSDALSVSLKGSGDIQLDVDAASIDAKLNGSGDMKLSGKTTDFEVKTTGSGDFEGKNLIAENTQVYISGSGGAKVNARSSLKARVQGSGTVTYSGSPASNDSKVMGSGSVKPM